jgi:hypothetical protein
MRWSHGFTRVQTMLAVGLLLLSTHTGAQVWNIEVIEQAEDTVGQRLVFSVKEGIRRSASRARIL